MNPYSSRRDGYRSSDPRGRSRSPPPSRDFQEREAPHARINRDHDAPPKLLPRKPGTSANALPVSASGSLADNHASTSASASAHDRNVPTSRPEPSTLHGLSGAAPASAAVIGTHAELAGRLYVSKPDIYLFEIMQAKNLAIFKDQMELDDQKEKLDRVQGWFDKANSNDPRHLARLTDQQKIVKNLQQKVQSATLDLYRLQVDFNVQSFTSLMTPILAQFESRLQGLHREAQEERERDRKVHEELQKAATTHWGQINRCQSDVTKIKGDLSALTKDNDRLHNDAKNMRKDLDADVARIKDNRERIKRLETEVAAMPDKAAKSVAGMPSAAGASVRAATTAPSSPAAAHVARSSAPSTVLDPGSGTAAQPNAAPASAWTAVPTFVAATNHSTTQHPPPPLPAAVSSSPSVSEAVTRAQFRKWVRGHEQDLELRFDEVIDRAVHEALMENRACMDDRIRALARSWKSKVLRGEGASTEQTQAAINANTGDPASATAVAADGAESMEIETEQEQQNQVPAQRSLARGPPGSLPCSPVAVHTTANRIKPTQAAIEQTSQNGVPAITSIQSQPVSAGATVSSAPTATSSGVSIPGPASEPHKGGTASIASAMMTNATETTQRAAGGAGQSHIVKQDGTQKRMTDMPVEVLAAIRGTLNEHGMKLAAIEQKVDALAFPENESFARLIGSPDKVKQLVELLRENGLFDVATAVSSVLVQIQPNIDQIRARLGALRTSQQVLEAWRPEIVATVDKKAADLQKQLEMLDDQCSLQGALLVKLVEHANPRQTPVGANNSASGGGAQASPVTHSSAVRSPMVQPTQHAQAPPVPRPSPLDVSPLSNPIMRPPSGMDAAATALSAHMQPAAQQRPVMHQVLAQRYPQPPQHVAHAVTRGTNQYQDPNHRQGYH